MKPNHKAGIKLESIEEQHKALTTLIMARLGVEELIVTTESKDDMAELSFFVDNSIKEEKKSLQLDSAQTELLKEAASLALHSTHYSLGIVDCYRESKNKVQTREQAINQMSQAGSPMLQRSAVIAGAGLTAAEFIVKLDLVA